MADESLRTRVSLQDRRGSVSRPRGTVPLGQVTYPGRVSRPTTNSQFFGKLAGIGQQYLQRREQDERVNGALAAAAGREFEDVADASPFTREGFIAAQGEINADKYLASELDYITREGYQLSPEEYQERVQSYADEQLEAYTETSTDNRALVANRLASDLPKLLAQHGQAYRNYQLEQSKIQARDLLVSTSSRTDTTSLEVASMVTELGETLSTSDRNTVLLDAIRLELGEDNHDIYDSVGGREGLIDLGIPADTINAIEADRRAAMAEAGQLDLVRSRGRINEAQAAMLKGDMSLEQVEAVLEQEEGNYRNHPQMWTSIINDVVRTHSTRVLNRNSTEVLALQTDPTFLTEVQSIYNLIEGGDLDYDAGVRSISGLLDTYNMPNEGRTHYLNRVLQASQSAEASGTRDSGLRQINELLTDEEFMGTFEDLARATGARMVDGQLVSNVPGVTNAAVRASFGDILAARGITDPRVVSTMLTRMETALRSNEANNAAILNDAERKAEQQLQSDRLINGAIAGTGDWDALNSSQVQEAFSRMSQNAMQAAERVFPDALTQSQSRDELASQAYYSQVGALAANGVNDPITMRKFDEIARSQVVIRDGEPTDAYLESYQAYMLIRKASNVDVAGSLIRNDRLRSIMELTYGYHHGDTGQMHSTASEALLASTGLVEEGTTLQDIVTDPTTAVKDEYIDDAIDQALETTHGFFGARQEQFVQGAYTGDAVDYDTVKEAFNADLRGLIHTQAGLVLASNEHISDPAVAAAQATSDVYRRATWFDGGFVISPRGTPNLAQSIGLTGARFDEADTAIKSYITNNIPAIMRTQTDDESVSDEVLEDLWYSRYFRSDADSVSKRTRNGWNQLTGDYIDVQDSMPEFNISVNPASPNHLTLVVYNNLDPDFVFEDPGLQEVDTFQIPMSDIRDYWRTQLTQ